MRLLELPNSHESVCKGQETVRVDRELKAGAVDPVRDATIVIPVERLQGKGKNRYFSEAIKLPPGQVYLSKININRENKVHQWDLPVIRASSPVYSQDGERALGVVVINRKFDAIADRLDRPDAQYAPVDR